MLKGLLGTDLICPQRSASGIGIPIVFRDCQQRFPSQHPHRGHSAYIAFCTSTSAPLETRTLNSNTFTSNLYSNTPPARAVAAARPDGAVTVIAVLPPPLLREVASSVRKVLVRALYGNVIDTIRRSEQQQRCHAVGAHAYRHQRGPDIIVVPILTISRHFS
jgi:hypothetical protein